MKTLIQTMGSEVAAIIVEPIAGNMGLVMPDPIFLSDCVTLRINPARC